VGEEEEGMITGNCPACGLKFNARDESIDTMRKCQGCGHKFVIVERPRRRMQSAMGCFLVIILVLLAVVGALIYGSGR
jgi:DNA-directed RNA polymerase subunit RPC12/RpoP